MASSTSVPAWLEEEHEASPDDACVWIEEEHVAPPDSSQAATTAAAPNRDRMTDRLKKSAAGLAKVTKSVGNQLQKVNLARLIDEMEQDQEIADRLEFVNQETKEEAARKDLVREATAACQAEIETHLDEFLDNHANATYEEWIQELHPDNVERGNVFSEFTQLDIRFYVKDSDHRLLWNQHERVSEDRQVAARSYKHSSSRPEPIDLLDEQNPTDTSRSTDEGEVDCESAVAGRSEPQEPAL